MASLEVLRTQNDSGSYQCNDYSLLAEVEVSSDVAQNKDASQHSDDSFNFTNMQSALTVGILPDSSVEVHSQMNALIEEKNQLKEMLNKNNLMLEEDLKNAKEKISSLENENSELHKKIADAVKMEEQGSCIKCTTLDTGLKNMLGMDYIEENQTLLMEWSSFRENLYGNLKYICQHLEDASRSKKTWEEKILLDSYVLMLKFKLAFLEGNVEDVVQFASLQTDEETGFEVVRLKPREDPLLVEMLRKEVREKDIQLSSLKEEKDKFLEKMKGYELKLQECEAQSKSRYELVSNKLKTETVVSLQIQESCKIPEQVKGVKARLEMNSGKMSGDQVIKELQEEILNLKEILKLEQQASKKDKKRLTEIMTKCEKLQVDYDRVTKLLEIQSKDEKEKRNLKELDAKRHMEEADHLIAKLIDAQEQLDEKNTEIRKLRDILAQYTKKKSHSVKIQGETSDQKNQNGEAEGLILCPICSKGFTNERAAENHTNRCLEENK